MPRLARRRPSARAVWRATRVSLALLAAASPLAAAARLPLADQARLAGRAPRSGSRVPIRRAQDTGDTTRAANVLQLGATAAYPVMRYGGHCDGATDDLAALRAAAAAAERAGGGYVVLPAATCVIGDTWTIGAGGGPYHHVGIVGQGSDVSVLEYVGRMNRPAVFFDHVSDTPSSGFQVRSANYASTATHGTAVGILVGADRGSGTQSTNVGFTDVSVAGFRYGLVLGQSPPSVADASEFQCHACNFAYNDVGTTSSGYNTLNLSFYDSGWGENARGYEIGGDGTYARQVSVGPHIYGGSTTSNRECDFCFGNPFDVTVIQGVRAEPHGYFVSGTTGRLLLIGDTVTPTARADHVVVRAQNGNLTIEGNSFGGTDRGPWDTIVVDAADTLAMIGNRIGTGTRGLPFTASCANVSQSFSVRLVGNQSYDGPSTYFPDLSGFFSCTGQFTDRGVVQPFERFDAPNAADPAGGLRLTRVRSLAYGSLTPGNNLWGRVTFASSGSAVFTFTRVVPVTTLSGAVAGVTNPQVIAFAAGAITARDVGWPIRIPGVASANCTSGSGDAYGTIVEVIDDTHALIAPVTYATSAPGHCAPEMTIGRAGVMATIGVDEPDAHWYPVGMLCNRNETMSYDDKTLTARGVTFESSNPASTATCQFLIVR